MTNIELLRCGTFIKLPAVESIELMSLAGFDHVVIDLEHAPLSVETMSTLIAIARGCNITSLVRLPSHGPEWIQRALDAGASGILVPHVDTPQEAEEIVQAASLRRNGTRGFGPTVRAGGWALSGTEAYLSSSQEAMVIVQIESQRSVEAVEEIASSGVSAVFVGPADLGHSMRDSGVALREACAQVLQTAHEKGIPCGIAAPNGRVGAARLKEGFDFTVVGNDMTLLGTAAIAARSETMSTPE